MEINHKLIFYILYIFINKTHCTNSESYFSKNTTKFKTSSLSLIDDTRQDTIQSFKILWRNLTESNDILQKPISDLELLQEFKKIIENIAKAEESLSYLENNLFWNWSYALVDTEINRIKTYYETISKLIKKQRSQMGWTDLAETYLQSSDNGIKKILEKIHRYVIGFTDKSDTIFDIPIKDISSNICNINQSPYQIIYNLYNTVALAELKGNIVLQFSYMLLKLYNMGNFTTEALLAESFYEERTKQKISVAKSVLKGANRSIFRCDPKQYVSGVNYVQLTKLVQGYIENEINLNPYETCMENCDYYTYTEYNSCYKQQFCSQQPSCRGKVLNCRYIDSDMNICISSDPNKRYDWVEYEKGKVFGTKGVCEKKKLFKVDSWWRYLFWHCSYCFCLCDEKYESDRYFNLRNVTSDIYSNRIVTGVRLVKQNRIIHIQIQEGVLKSKGYVDKSTLSWKPVENYTLHDGNIQAGIDYHTIEGVQNGIDLDDVFEEQPEHIVTGVRFRRIGTHINLEVRISPFNFNTGEVFKESNSYWIGNDKTEVSRINPRTEVKLNNPDIPVRKGPHTVHSENNKFVSFQVSSFDTDVGQSTVPFLDSQRLTSQGFPLSGIGLIHRGKKGSGGFISPKLITYDFAVHLDEKLLP